MPGDFVHVHAFAIEDERPGIILHSRSDHPRSSIIQRPGAWRLKYRIVSLNFPRLEFTVKLHLVGNTNVELRLEPRPELE